MKTKSLRNQAGIAALAFIILFPSVGMGQSVPSMAVANMDTKNIAYSPEDMGDFFRIALEKKGTFNIVDKYDMRDILSTKGVDINNCYGKSCIVNIGKALEVDKVLTGSVERFGDKIVISLRMIDVKSELIEKTNVTEYQNLLEELHIMIEISVNNVLDIENDPNLVELLVNYDEPITSKYVSVNLNGPRMGVAFITGDMANALRAPKSEGGYDGYPLLSQFGYQYEKQYLSAGDFKALIEFLGMVSGLEQQLFIPAVVFMNGFRFGEGNWEVAFGPSLSLKKVATGFYDVEGALGSNGAWHLDYEWSNAYPEVQNPNTLVERMDSRGQVEVSSGWIWAVGRTFRSGYLNIPVNVYCAPQKQGWYIGWSVGFNINRTRKVTN